MRCVLLLWGLAHELGWLRVELVLFHCPLRRPQAVLSLRKQNVVMPSYLTASREHGKSSERYQQTEKLEPSLLLNR